VSERPKPVRDAPLIHDGIDPPVKKPTQSLVKELQLKSTCPDTIRDTSVLMRSYDSYPRGDTRRKEG
jgi:hypothetical protein